MKKYNRRKLCLYILKKVYYRVEFQSFCVCRGIYSLLMSLEFFWYLLLVSLLSSQGTGPLAPAYLRHEGAVRNRKLNKRDTLLLISDIWCAKKETAAQREMPLAEFLEAYFRERWGRGWLLLKEKNRFILKITEIPENTLLFSSLQELIPALRFPVCAQVPYSEHEGRVVLQPRWCVPTTCPWGAGEWLLPMRSRWVALAHEEQVSGPCPWGAGEGLLPMRSRWVALAHEEQVSGPCPWGAGEWLLPMRSRWVALAHEEQVRGSCPWGAGEWLLPMRSRWVALAHEEQVSGSCPWGAGEWLLPMRSRWVALAHEEQVSGPCPWGAGEGLLPMRSRCLPQVKDIPSTRGCEPIRSFKKSFSQNLSPLGKEYFAAFGTSTFFKNKLLFLQIPKRWKDIS